MSGPQTLALLGPHGLGPDGIDAFATALADALAASDGVAAVILRLAIADERALTALVKRISPVTQAREAALVVACAGFSGDLVAVATRGGADGVHLDKPRDLKDWRGRLREGRILGAGGLETRHAAMEAGEAGIDYLMFGGLYPDGVAPDPETVLSRTGWWAEIFETPCIAVAATEAEIGPLAATGAEFVGLESALWLPDARGVARARRTLEAAA